MNRPNPPAPNQPPDKAIEAVAKWLYDEFCEIPAPGGWEGENDGARGRWTGMASELLDGPSSHIIASYEEQPNVLSKEEARLLAMGFYGELDDAPGDMLIAAQAVADRLSEWSDLHSEGGDYGNAS